MQNSPNYIEAQDILNATNGGLDIILQLYPQASGSEENRNRKFKMRGDEKTASANLHKADDGNWLVTDFGGDKQPRNAIGCYQQENNCDYVTALRELAAQYGIMSVEKASEYIGAHYSERPAGTDDKEGNWTWELRPDWSDLEIETIISKNVLYKVGWKSQDSKRAAAAPKTIADAFDSYNWYPLISYSLVKNRKVMTFAATERYPIYLIDEGSFQKLYQPLHPDKAKRFLYIGQKPKDFIHGLAQLEDQYRENVAEETAKVNQDKEQDDRDNKKDWTEENTIEKAARIKHVILCTGGSDAINVTLLGHYVLWLNSETAKLPEYRYKEINKCVEKFYQLPDIDLTGKRAAHELAMEYLDILTIELPEELKLRKDRRGGACKDVRDYFNHYKAKEFTKLLNVALPYRFWEKKAQYEGRGENRSFQGYRYEFKNTQANNFLMKNGFGRLKVGDQDTEWIFIKRTGNIVKEVDSSMIMDFIDEFLESRNMDIDLRDAMINTSKLNSSSLSRIKKIEIDFNDFTPTSQFYFFNNKSVEVTKDAVTFHKPGTVDRYIWDRDFLDHRIIPVEQPPFTITRNEFGEFDIEIHNKECLFLKFLIQVSRMHWRDELEQGEAWKAMTPEQQDEYAAANHCVIDGPNLTAEQIEEQKIHLINKIFSIGFLLHHYHDPTKGWFVYAVDGKVSEDGRSHGGSGKSIMMSRGIRSMLPSTYVMAGRNLEAIEDKFRYDGVKPYHRYYYVDDAHERLNLEIFYSDFTEDLVAHRKGTSSIIIPYAKSGKFGFTANFMPKDISPSTERRIIFSVFSDYYHNKGENDDYLQFRDPKTDLGMSMFVGFNDENKQYNHFFHTMLYCLKFFLGVDEKLKPGMENVNKRTLLSEMGDNFHAWAIAYFNEDGEHVDKFVVREYAFEEYKIATKDKYTSANSWFKKVIAFCRYYGFVFNPTKYLNGQKKIIKKAEVKHFDNVSKQWVVTAGAEKVTKEMIFIQTNFEKLPEDPFVGHPPKPETPEDPNKPKLDF